MPVPIETRLRRALKSTYDTTGVIGSGGMGSVYLATHKQLGNKVAIKVLSEELATDATVVERFLNEAKIEANLQHPNIVRVFDVRKQGNLHYLVMDYVEGEDLTDRMRCMPAGMPEKDVVNVALQILRALQCAHDHKIVHRDLKPSNIRIDKYGTVRVMDFGIAQARNAAMQSKTVLGQKLGTPMYMSPEQIRGETLDARSDIYSLGVILYEMVSGSNPFAAEHQHAVYLNHLSLVPPPLDSVRTDISADLSQVVSRMLEKDPDNRWESAAVLIPVFQALAGETQLSPFRPELFHEDDIPLVVPETVLDGTLPKEEKKLLRLVNGSRTLRQLRDLSRFKTEQFYRTLVSLHEKRVIRTNELETRSKEVAPRPATPPAPPVADDALSKTPWPSFLHSFSLNELRSTRVLTATIGIALAVAGLLMWQMATSKDISGSQSTAGGLAVQFDASPFAVVTVLDGADKVLATQETPFVWNLREGSYRAEFEYNGEKRSTSFTVDGKPVSLREDFWSGRQTRELLQKYLE
jgi:serine/threonine protein kinase